MAKTPSDAKVREYDDTQRFCSAMLEVMRKVGEHDGVSIADTMPERLPDYWREGQLPFPAALKSANMTCRDFLQATRDFAGKPLQDLDQLLAGQDIPTITQMRAKHWEPASKTKKINESKKKSR
jgi:hypothetical protein